MRNNYIFRPALGTMLVLLVPLFMMLVRAEGWQWGPLDFVAMGVLVFCAGFAYEYLSDKVTTMPKRIAIGVGVAAILFAIWVELAVDGVSQLVQYLFA